MLGLGLSLALGACSGGGTTVAQGSSAKLTGKLAYVVSECRENAAGFLLHQAMEVRQGERDPVTVMEAPEISGLARFPLTCQLNTAILCLPHHAPLGT